MEAVSVPGLKCPEIEWENDMKKRHHAARRERSCLKLLFVPVLSGMLILAEPKLPLIHPTCLLSVPEDNMTSKRGFLLTRRIRSLAKVQPHSNLETFFSQ